jgi:hypothetical protein
MVGKDKTLRIKASGYPKPSFTETGALPRGVTFESGSGYAELTGTPATGSGNLYTFTLTATNSKGSDTEQYSLTVQQDPVFPGDFCPGTLTVGHFTRDSETVAAWPPFFGLTETSPLPTGMQFIQAPTTENAGVLTGTPAAGTGGKWNLKYSADAGTITRYHTCKVVVDQEPSFSGPATGVATVGTKLAAPIEVTGTSGYPRHVTPTSSGTVPAGLTMMSRHGGKTFGEKFTGKPSTGSAGDYLIDIGANNGAGTTVTQGFVLVVRTKAVTPAPTTVTLTPTAPATTYLTTITFTATVKGGTSPAGYVQFFREGADAPVTVPLSHGVATFTTPATLNAGNYHVTATYTGDPRNASSTASTSLTVSPASTTLDLSPSANSAALGGSATFTATVTSAAGTPQGVVDFEVGGIESYVDLNGAGRATFHTPATLTVTGDPYTVQATFLSYTDSPGDWAKSNTATALLDVGLVDLTGEVAWGTGPGTNVAAPNGATLTVLPGTANEVAADLAYPAGGGTPAGPVTIDVHSATGHHDYTATLGLTASEPAPSADPDTGRSDYFWTIASNTLTTLGVSTVTVTVSYPGSASYVATSLTFSLKW